MTQDNTPPGPIFKAGLFRTEEAASPGKGAVRKISPISLRKRVVWCWKSHSLASNRALKIGPVEGGVFLVSHTVAMW